jgi:kumamolisin
MKINAFSEEKIPKFPLSHPRARPFVSFPEKSASPPLTPTDVYAAYGTDLSESPGKNVKIALIEAFGSDSAKSDFEKFGKAYSLPENSLEIEYPFGASALCDSKWAAEIHADSQWAYAIAPYAEIVCVVAKNADLSSLALAAEYAVRELRADVISMSFGAEEYSAQLEIDRLFAQNKAVYVASSGDVGSTVFYPSSSSHVISAGGCVLHTNVAGKSFERSAWPHGGGGPSRYTGIPVWQRRFKGLSSLSGRARATPDVSLNAADVPGYSVYISGMGGFTSVGGTSVSAPVFAGMCARIIQKSADYKNYNSMSEYLYARAGKTHYANPQYAFYDVHTGNSGKYKALFGYDFCTGLGAPNVRALEK